MTKIPQSIRAWVAKSEDGAVYYSCRHFFGVRKNGKQIIASCPGEVDEGCWYEIAQQLFAMMKGYAY
jgi:hypothetical protein